MNTRLIPLALSVSLLALTGCSRSGDAPEESAAAAVPADTAPAAAAEAKPDVSAYFATFLAENYKVDMARFPMSASYRGLKTNPGKWNPASEAFREETRAINDSRLTQLMEIDRASLPAPQQLSWDLYQSDLQRTIASDEYRHHKYVIHQFRGPHTMVPSSLISIQSVKSAEEAGDYISRIEDTSTYFDQVIEQMQIRTEKGMFLPAWSYPQMITASRNVITGAPYDDGADSTIWADFQSKVKALGLAADAESALLDKGRKALTEQLKPAYERLIAAMEAQGAKASMDDGVWKFPNGEAFYAERLQWFTTTDLSADEVHDIGLREMDRIHNEMRSIMEQVEFEGSLQEFFEFMRTDEQFYYPNTDEGREAYLAEATRLIDVMRERLPEQFGLLPKADMVVKRVEPFRERSAGKAFYQAPPPDGSRPGIYYANLYNMADMPTYQMEALAYHEGLPGHHMQRAISVELDGIPEFQKYASFTAYTEGWGLYTEQLPKEMGFYEDPYADFGRLAMELWRAARLVVDTGIHHKRWTREQAIEYLVANTPNPRGDCTKAIERYIAMPGQATAYLIGKLKIIELREKAREALGDGFDIRAFHDEVLKDGPVPLSMLEAKIDRYIASAAES